MKKIIGIILLVSVAFLIASCGGGGGGSSASAPAPNPQPGPGPGDQTNLFPITMGNTWRYHGVESTTGQGQIEYFNTAKVTGTKMINGTDTTVVTMTSSLNGGTTYDNYYTKTDKGVFNYGNNDPTDTITRQVVPYPEILFPVQAGTGFSQYSKSGLDSGVDLDGDGINDKVAVSATVTVADFETVFLSIGIFPSVARVVRTENLTFTLSSNGAAVPATESDAIYLASGVGIIKQSATLSIPAANFSTNRTEELTGYLVDGQGKGIVAEETLAAGIAPADSDTETPGRPAVAFDGSNYLVVSRRVAGATDTMTGTIITPADTVVASFDIGGPGSNRSGVAYGGGKYLVAFTRNGQIVANRITPGGVVLDGPAGIAVSSVNPSTTNFEPAIAFDGTNFLVVWQQFSSQYDIQGALVTPSGQVLREFSLFAAPGEQIEPTVAFDGTNYLVAWRDTRSGSGPAADTDIYATRVKPDGTVLDPAGIPVSTAPATQDSPQLTFSGGQYLAVWLDFRNNIFGNPAIYGTRIGTDGSLLDGPASTGGIAIDTSLNITGSPTVAPFGNYFLVAWQVPGYGPPGGIYGARVSANGQVVSLATGGAVFPISGSPTVNYDSYIYPVAATGASNSLVVWINNRETTGTTKDLQAALLYPF
ncbi:MAG TPA: hypothetical protein VL949_00835 [Geobacteraceae bacterium]|nr:hypothetical protein [Geobacteraceae bacterium]